MISRPSLSPIPANVSLAGLHLQRRRVFTAGDDEEPATTRFKPAPAVDQLMGSGGLRAETQLPVCVFIKTISPDASDGSHDLH